jgi:DNA ligase 1
MKTPRIRPEPLSAAPLVLACFLALRAEGQPLDVQPPPLMLANALTAEVDVSDYWVSEKYDGIRAYWDGQGLRTRAGHPLRAPGWFVAGWPAQALDGELWIGRGQFEAVAATVRDRVPDDDAWRRVRFMVFDLPSHPGPYTERLGSLLALLARHPARTLRLVEQTKVTDQTALRKQMRAIVAAGGEGVMLHRGSSLYRAGRSDDLLKFKAHEDAEALVVAHLPGKGKYQGMLGALEVRRSDGVTFRVGSGLSDEQRRHPPPIGSWITYAYQGVTANGVPRFARFLRVRDEPISVR